LTEDYHGTRPPEEHIEPQGNQSKSNKEEREVEKTDESEGETKDGNVVPKVGLDVSREAGRDELRHDETKCSGKVGHAEESLPRLHGATLLCAEGVETLIDISGTKLLKKVMPLFTLEEKPLSSACETVPTSGAPTVSIEEEPSSA